MILWGEVYFTGRFISCEGYFTQRAQGSRERVHAKRAKEQLNKVT